jgi:hypothetical protein
MYTGPKISKDGLVLHLDGASERSLVSGSSTWVNLADTGTGCDGIIQNATWIPNYGGGLMFTTSSTQRVLVPTGSNGELNFGSGSFTVEILGQGNDDFDRSMIIYRNDGGGDKGWYLEMRGKPTADPPQISNDLEDGVLTDNGITGPNWVNGEVFHHVLIRDGDTERTYHNGVAFNSQSLVGLGDVDFSTYVYIGGGGSYYGSVSVYMVRLYKRALSADEVYRNYISSVSRVEDYDVKRFVKRIQDDGNSLSATEVAAVNYLVYGFKANGTWDKRKIIYPFVGGTADTHKYNLKDPRDADGAFRITWSGTVTHDASGSTGNGSTGYGNTYFVPTEHLSNTSYSLGVYYQDDVTENSGIGVKDGTAYWTIYPDFGGTFYSYAGATANAVTVAGIGDTSNKLFVSTQNGGTTHKAFATGSQIGTTNTGDNTTSWNTLLEPMYIGAVNRDGTAGEYSTRTISLVFIADGLTDTEILNDYDVIQKFQTMLGRRV